MKPSIEQVFAIALECCGVGEEEYASIANTRERKAVEVRQVCCLLGQRVGHSQSTIGRFLGIDHSTVCHNKRTAQDLCDTDGAYASRVIRAVDALDNIAKRIKECVINGWVSRDKDGGLTLFSEKPNRDVFQQGEGFWCGDCPRELDPTLFPQITWYSEPVECEMTLRLK